MGKRAPFTFDLVRIKDVFFSVPPFLTKEGME